MTQLQQAKLPELLQNLAMSSQMEGFEVTEAMESMYLSILNGEATLAECLARIRAKHAARNISYIDFGFQIDN